jgi:hypothetical protein
VRNAVQHCFVDLGLLKGFSIFIEKVHQVASLSRHLAQFRRHHSARSAPWRPEIYQYRQSRSAYQRIERQIAWDFHRFARGGQLGLAFAATKCPLQRFVLETIALPTFWASHEQSVIVCSNHTHNEVSRLEVCPRVIWILSSAI